MKQFLISQLLKTQSFLSVDSEEWTFTKSLKHKLFWTAVYKYFQFKIKFFLSLLDYDLPTQNVHSESWPNENDFFSILTMARYLLYTIIQSSINLTYSI